MKKLFILLFSLLIQFMIVDAQVEKKGSETVLAWLPAIINHQMPDFTLPVFGGGEFTLSKNLGKNVLVVFPRGWIGTEWCQLCHYQYTELLDMMNKQNLKDNLNLVVVFILPYPIEKVADWVIKMPVNLSIIEQWKSGKNDFSAYMRENYPVKYEVNTKELSIPILVDGDTKLSKNLQLFTESWDGVKAEQNIPTVFLLDKTGKIRFKYHSQSTFDRPTAQYLVTILKSIIG